MGNSGSLAMDSRGVGRSAFEAAPMPMAEFDCETSRVRYVNRPFCSLVGKTEEELVGSDFSDLTPMGEEFRSLFLRVCRTGHAELHAGQEYTVSHPLYWSYTLWPVFANDGQVGGIVLLVIETTPFHEDAIAMNRELLLGSVRQHEQREAAELLAEHLQAEIIGRKSAEEALIRSEKLASVGRMAAVLAHEINNPLAAVMGILYMAQRAENLSGEVADYLERADGELKRIAHITRQTLGFYRESIERTTFFVAPLLESALDLLKSKIHSKQALVERQCDPELQITSTQGELQQVISNILLNSLDAVTGKGRVVLRARRSTNPKDGRPRVRLTVADNGRGISEAVRPHIFEAFFTTKGNIGNGLGLWVGEQIITKRGGAIQVRSATDGSQRGTTVSVLLPLVTD